MKIIDNKKDYYDYVVGEYGIDDLIVFDRRNSVVVPTYFVPKNNQIDFIFSSLKSEKDAYKREDFRDEKYGEFYGFALKTGNVLYLFNVERYLIDENNVNVDMSLFTTIENKQNLCPDLTLAIIPFKFHSYLYRPKDTEYLRTHFHLENKDIIKDDILNLPILKNTPIPKFISARDIYLNIYSFLSAKKDIKLGDNRTDIQKLQSAGFDKAVSFRNIK